MIAYDTVSTINTVSGGTSGITGNTITCSGNLLLVAIQSSATDLANVAVTYNGVSMTQITAVNSTAATRMFIFGLLNPTTGSAISPIATWTFHATATVNLDSISYIYTNTSLPTVTSNTTNFYAGGTAIYNVPGTLTTDSTPNSWIVGYADNGTAGATMSAGSGTALRTASTSHFGWIDSNGTVPASSSTTIAATCTTNNTHVYQVVSLEVSPGPVTFTTSDTVTATETVSVVRGAAFSIADTMALTETITFVRGAVFSIADTIGLTDLFTLIYKWTRQDTNASSWTKQNSASTSTVIRQSKNSSSWNNQTKT